MKVIDLTHTIQEGMPVYPGTEPPVFEPANSYEIDGFRETRISMFTHTGTHIDPPAHLFAGRTTLDSFPPEQQQQIRVQISMVMEGVISQQLIPTLNGGVQPAFEIMFLNNAIRNMIRESKIHQIDNVIATSQKEGMIAMDTSLIQMYQKGIISKEDAIIHSNNSELMAKKIERL